MFQDRSAAGRLLADKLAGYARRSDLVVLALPRGGVPVAFEVARRLGASLDVFVVRKLGVPGQDELAMGAIASGNVRVFNDDVVGYLNIPPDVIEGVAARESQELERRERFYRSGRPLLEIAGRTVILVDDGLATGSTMRAAIKALRRLEPARMVVAVPVAPPSTCAELRVEVDEVVCLLTPDPFDSVGRWYRNFKQTTDSEVQQLLENARLTQSPGPDRPPQ